MLSRTGWRALRAPLTVAILAGFPAAASAQDLVLAGGNVVDVRTGQVQAASVFVRDGVIQAVAPTLQAPPGAEVVDVAGHWIIPGLVELHSHTTDDDTLRRALALGVTSTLTIYTGTEFVPPGWEGPSRVPGNPVPRMYLVGGRFRVEDIRPGVQRYMLAPSTPEEAAADLDTYLQQGVERIKVWVDDGTVQFETVASTFDDRMVSALVAGARARGMEVYVHALTGELYRRALAAAPTWIIHPMVTDALTDADVETIKAADLGWTTVISIVLWNADPRRYARLVLADPRLTGSLSEERLAAYRTEAQLADNPHAATRPRIVERGPDYLETVRRNLRLAVDSGLTIAVGSDRTAGHGTHVEIELLRDAGLDAATVLRAATLGGAEALRVSDRFGTVEPGKIADLVVLSSDPLAEITNLRDVELVLKGGRPWRPPDLLGR